jgi:hypothetical protein
VATGHIKYVNVGPHVLMHQRQVGVLAIAIAELGSPGVEVPGLERRKSLVPRRTVRPRLLVHGREPRVAGQAYPRHSDATASKSFPYTTPDLNQSEFRIGGGAFSDFDGRLRHPGAAMTLSTRCLTLFKPRRCGVRR